MSLTLFYSVLNQTYKTVSSSFSYAVTWASSTLGSGWTLSNLNLTATNTSTNTTAYVNTPISSGSRKYIEFNINTLGASGRPIIGFDSAGISGSDYLGDNVPSTRITLGQLGNNTNYYNGTGVSNPRATGLTWTGSGAIAMVAMDMIKGQVFYGVNGSWSGGIYPGASSNPNFLWPTSSTAYLGASGQSTDVISIPSSTNNFTYYPPIGYTGWDGNQKNGGQSIYWDSLNSCGLSILSNNQRTFLYPNQNGTNWFVHFLNQSVNSGKYYIEFVVAGTQTIQAGEDMSIGLATTKAFSYTGAPSYQIGGDTSFVNSLGLMLNGGINSVSNYSTGTYTNYMPGTGSLLFPPGTIFQLAFDLSVGYVWYGANGTWFNSVYSGGGVGNPGAGSYPCAIASFITGGIPIYIGISLTCNGSTNPIGTTVNGNSSQWTYTRPTGFTGLDGS